MKKIQKLIATYSAKGHPMYPEDTWDWELEVSNENELYRFMIDIHKRDARHFNDYPLVGECSKNGFKFEMQNSVIIDNETFVSPIRIASEKPDYFESAYKKYDELCNRMSKTIPRLRKYRDIREKELSERNQYELLKHKFES